MARHKRKHAEFTSDTSELANTARPSTQSTSAALGPTDMPDRTTSIPDDSSLDQAEGNGLPDQGDWQVSLSKKAKKKKKKQGGTAVAPEGSSVPLLHFPNPVVNPLRVKDLQALILYVLSDGVAPTWLALKNGKLIDQVVAVIAPGIDHELLSSFMASVSDLRPSLEGSDKNLETASQRARSTEDDTGDPGRKGENTEVPPTTPRPGSIVPVKAPGDPKTGRMHSTIQSMLISPEEKVAKGSYVGADHVFAPVRTPITQLVHTADELLEADYPVHPAIFTNPKDAELEKTRREAAGQSAMSGWVDSRVDSHTTPTEDVSRDSTDLSAGMQVYALDCEMVLTTDDVYSLARVSVLDWNSQVVLDKLVRPSLPIKDYCTQFSGITEKLLEEVRTSLADIQQELCALWTPSTILLGHSLESDFNALKMTHPFVLDTSMLYPHPRGMPLRSSLKFLANKYLKREIQKGGELGHDSIEDAQAVLDLIRLKCEKGPKFGTMDSNGESIFGRLNASGCKTAMVGHGNSQKGLGRLASIHVGCNEDEEIAVQIGHLMSATDPIDKVNFVWAELRDLDAAGRLGSSKKSEHTNGSDVNAHDIDTEAQELDKTSSSRTRETETASASSRTIANLRRVYESLAPFSLLIVVPGPGEMGEVIRLQNMRKQYQKEFKVKKWNELSVKWTDDEVQALKKAFEVARKGWGLVCLKGE